MLILGELGLARILARQAEMEGFRPILQAIEAPSSSLSRTSDVQEIRKLFSWFAKISEGQGFIHPGITPWAERPEISTVGQELNLTVVSPCARILSLFANKLNLLLEAEKLGIPNLVQSYDPIHSVREIQRFIRKTKQPFPFVVRAAKGSGQFSVQVVQSPQFVTKELLPWFEQLRWNTGEVILFPERYLEGARQFVVPFVRLKGQRAQIFPLLDSSLQSRFRKVVEFCPAYHLDSKVKDRLVEWTALLAEQFDYIGLGTLEFLVDGSRTYFLGGQARLNTAFHLWEKVAGTSALRWQLNTLEMPGLSRRAPSVLPETKWKPAVSARIYAEDSLFHFPHPGSVVELSTKAVLKFPNISAEVSLSYEAGQEVPVSASGLMGVVQAWQDDPGKPDRREEVIDAVKQVLSQTWISGSVQTNERFLHELLTHPWIREGIFHTGFIDEEFLPQVLPSGEELELAASVCAAIHPSEPTDRWMVGERWIRSASLLSPVAWIEDPQVWSHESQNGISGWVKDQQENSIRVCAVPVGNRWLVRLGHWFLTVRKISRPLVAVDKEIQRENGTRRLVALVSGRVHAVLFRAGIWIPQHDALVVLESFGVFVPHSLPLEVRVVEWKVEADEAVHLGQTLAILELRRKT